MTTQKICRKHMSVDICFGVGGDERRKIREPVKATDVGIVKSELGGVKDNILLSQWNITPKLVWNVLYCFLN